MNEDKNIPTNKEIEVLEKVKEMTTFQEFEEYLLANTTGKDLSKIDCSTYVAAYALLLSDKYAILNGGHSALEAAKRCQKIIMSMDISFLHIDGAPKNGNETERIRKYASTAFVTNSPEMYLMTCLSTFEELKKLLDAVTSEVENLKTISGDWYANSFMSLLKEMNRKSHISDSEAADFIQCKDIILKMKLYPRHREDLMAIDKEIRGESGCLSIIIPLVIISSLFILL